MCAETYNERLVNNRLMHLMCINCDFFRCHFKSDSYDWYAWRNIYLLTTIILNALIVIKCPKYNDKFK